MHQSVFSTSCVIVYYLCRHTIVSFTVHCYFHRQGKLGTEKLNNLLKVAQPVMGQAGVWGQEVWLQSPLFLISVFFLCFMHLLETVKAILKAGKHYIRCDVFIWLGPCTPEMTVRRECVFSRLNLLTSCHCSFPHHFGLFKKLLTSTCQYPSSNVSPEMDTGFKYGLSSTESNRSVQCPLMLW